MHSPNAFPLSHITPGWVVQAAVVHGRTRYNLVAFNRISFYRRNFPKLVNMGTHRTSEHRTQLAGLTFSTTLKMLLASTMPSQEPPSLRHIHMCGHPDSSTHDLRHATNMPNSAKNSCAQSPCDGD